MLRRYKYNMRHSFITEGDLGYLQPFFCQEVTPGDTWSGKSYGLIRMSPMNVPVFTALKLSCFFFYVPHRIVWPEFEDVITGKDTVTAWPTEFVSLTEGSAYLQRAMGIGYRSGASGATINQLPLRAYVAVWNEFFRDKATEVEVAYGYPLCLQTSFTAKDYFSSARSEIQQDAEETIDTSGATLGVTNIRDALNRQKFRERRSQFGEEYEDYLRAMGLKVPASRLDRPEFVGRGSATMGISEVVATATSAGENTGEYKGHGIGSIGIRLPRRTFLEHGTLLGVMTMRPRQQLRQRVDRQFLVTDKDDLYQMELAGNTQVPVYKCEINSNQTAALALNVHSYQFRDEWLRSARDTVAGTQQMDSRSMWHCSRKFAADSAPTLQGLLQVPQYDDIWQDSAADKYFAYFEHQIGKKSIVPPRRK